MPRPRFHKLSPDQQQAILRAAFDEFAAHGFSASSLNRIIDAAGISKGSLYYYFDDKEELYAHVARRELGRLFEAAGPFPIPKTTDPNRFWSTLESYYRRIMTAFAASPKLAALARDWLLASNGSKLQQAQREMEGALVPWFEQALAAGQRVRAVRKDVPASLLIAVVFGMGQAMDTWLLTQELDTARVTKVVRMFIGMMRRTLAP
ncbi:MAG TPA: TetR/AcrR family transcriptional regulator [Gemmatimonadaceae bacterium]|nr:TetR/AcrR family transcriptional regulator [Gemmatimonadaceae bacterium]